MKPISISKDLAIEDRRRTQRKRNCSPKPAIEKLITQKINNEYNPHKGLITSKASGNNLPYPFRK